MKTRATFVLATIVATTIIGCTSPEDPQDGGNAGANAGELEFVVWPESGSTVFAEAAMYVGDPLVEGQVDGTIAVIAGGDAPKAGSMMPGNALKFETGKVWGHVELPTGKQSLHVHLFDADGKATGKGQTVDYTVEATPGDLGVQWLAPADGATVKSPFQVEFGLTGAGMSPAGQNALDKTLGHHHISINKGVVTPGMTLPMGVGHYLHYGKAQTKAEVTLEPGKYELTMQFADAAHRSYGKALAKTITVIVE